jgi:hypothetical protein
MGASKYSSASSLQSQNDAVNNYFYSLLQVPNSSEHQFDHRSMHSDENVGIASSSDDRTMTPVDLSNKVCV